MSLNKYHRLTRHQWAMELAKVTAGRSTCFRRNVGAVLLNSRGHVLSTGYNGVAAGLPHCNQGSLQNGVVVWPHKCPSAEAPSGTSLDGCHAIHAEQNALLQCRDVYAIDTLYSTAAPCITCTKLMMNTSCRLIVYLDDYPHSQAAKELWLASPDREWVHIDEL